MQFSHISAAFLALASSALAQTADFVPVLSPTQNQQVAAGSVLRIQWQPSSAHTGPVTIQLLQGATPSTLEVGATVAASIDQSSGAYDWTVPQDLKSFPTYGFKFVLDSNPQIFQYSFPFHVTGLTASPSTSSSAPTGDGSYATNPKPTSNAPVYSASEPPKTYAPAPTTPAIHTYAPPATYGAPNSTVAPSGYAPSASGPSVPIETYPGKGFMNSGSSLKAGSFAVLGGFMLALFF
ncbi:hypothetical protein PZA11_001700 [Diplocarpon coronariae]|uniref:GPI anchored serine-threonine rich protein n=1 Tax=Diplocarpon coronariae TaxID=2795749 RepID=A0A218YZI6_9HELO|nr:hypothetical protein JHW43_000326 [Diplocarpon mali]OWP01231.1 GPI anchored serine-threonine rich protein [Marssonina coronariae]